MKQLIKNIILFTAISLPVAVNAQDEKPELMVNAHYYAVNNSYQYLKADVKLKANNKLEPVKDVVLQLYLDSVSADYLIGKTWTNAKGEAKAMIPYALKEKWMSSPTHKFIVITEATQKSDETITELPVTKARLLIDTLNEDGTRSVRVKAEAFENGDWIPAKDVEVKIGAKRLGGLLRINDEESFTTDSTGYVTGEFKLTELPSDDPKKNITLVARTEDNELYGNLSIEKTVPWGQPLAKSESNFNKRTLWGTRDKTPIWLLFMAYSIIAAVWSVIIYLVFQIIKISKLGKQYDIMHANVTQARTNEYLID